MKHSFITHLECSLTGEHFDASIPHRTNPQNGKPLFPRYNLQACSISWNKESLRDRPPDMWRYHEVMPIQNPQNIISLGEGFTPLIHAKNLASKYHMHNLYIKDEGVNPTGSFKARGLSAAVSKAKELGITKLTMPSAGNAAGAMAAYAAAAGIEAHVFMPKDAPTANKMECKAHGANLTLVDGFITDAGRASAQAAEKLNLFDLSTLREPYRVEGKKTMGYEIIEQLKWKVPDVIVYPTGGGTGIVGIWKALDEMQKLGWIGTERPRMICVQAEGCSPIVNAYRNNQQFAEPFQNPKTLAAGMRVPAAVGDFLVIRAVRESGGEMVTVSDQEMLDAMTEMATSEGIYPAPEGGATLAAMKKLLQQNKITPQECTILLVTGNAHKYLDLLPKATR